MLGLVAPDYVIRLASTSMFPLLQIGSISQPPIGCYRSHSGDFIDQRTGMRVFFRMHMCPVVRRVLGPDEIEDNEEAILLASQSFDMRNSHCEANVLSDRVTLYKCPHAEGIPFRNWLCYKDIRQFTMGLIRKNYFSLITYSERTHNRSYEVYKCKSLKDVVDFQSHLRHYFRYLNESMSWQRITENVGPPPPYQSVNMGCQQSWDRLLDNDPPPPYTAVEQPDYVIGDETECRSLQTRLETDNDEDASDHMASLSLILTPST